MAQSAKPLTARTGTAEAVARLAAQPDPEPRLLSEIVAASLGVGCALPACAAQPGVPCDASGGVHLVRISLACRARHVTGPEFTAVITTASSPVFRPATLIRPEVSR